MSPRVGQALRKARVERGFELGEVEAATKIRAKFLAAMEEDRWEELPAPVYARGFISIYARFLGLDDQALLDEFARTVAQEEPPEPIPRTAIRPGVLSRRHTTPRGLAIKPRPVAMLVAGLIAAMVLVLVVIGSLGGSNEDGRGADDHRERAADGTATAPGTTTTARPASGQIALELRSSADVWVCLVDDRGRALVNGETLTSGESRGPFASRGYEVTVGNGFVEMTDDGEPAEIPPVAAPLGYRITATGVRELDPASQPTCLS
jgi:cytoskeleton protein RodZ